MKKIFVGLVAFFILIGASVSAEAQKLIPRLPKKPVRIIRPGNGGVRIPRKPTSPRPRPRMPQKAIPSTRNGMRDRAVALALAPRLERQVLATSPRATYIVPQTTVVFPTIPTDILTGSAAQPKAADKPVDLTIKSEEPVLPGMGAVLPEKDSLKIGLGRRTIAQIEQSVDVLRDYALQDNYRVFLGINESYWRAVTRDTPPYNYTNTEELGRALENFYGKDAPRVMDHWKEQSGALYRLPVEEIRYAPQGYEPLILKPEKYAVFKTAQGTQIFKWSDIVKGIEQGRFEIEDLEHMSRFSGNYPKTAAELLDEYQKIAEHARAMGWGENWWRLHGRPWAFTSADELGDILHVYYHGDAPIVHNWLLGKKVFVYEIPVYGLTYRLGEQAPRILNPQNEVILYDINTGKSQLMRRESLRGVYIEAHF